MENSIPLFKKILETNYLIKGRLNVKPSELEKLYVTLQKDDDRLRKKQTHHEKMINSQIIKRNAIKVQRKRNSESLLKSFYPTRNKVSLLYKNQGGAFYIKARFYWEGRQREVQVGSIPIVIEIINNMLENKKLHGVKNLNFNKLTWEEINKRPELIDAIKEIASLKAQEYILRRLLAAKVNVMDKTDDHKEDIIPLEREEKQNENADNNAQNGEQNEEIEGVEWYEKWRRENL